MTIWVQWLSKVQLLTGKIQYTASSSYITVGIGDRYEKWMIIILCKIMWAMVSICQYIIYTLCHSIVMHVLVSAWGVSAFWNVTATLFHQLILIGMAIKAEVTTALDLVASLFLTTFERNLTLKYILVLHKVMVLSLVALSLQIKCSTCNLLRLKKVMVCFN